MSQQAVEGVISLRDNFTNPMGRIIRQNQQFIQSSRALPNVASGFKSVAKSVVGVASAYVGLRAIGGFIKDSIKMASDLQEVQNVVDTTFKNSAKSINDFAKTSLNSFGLTELQAKKFSGTMGAMLKSTGVTGDKLVEMSTNLTGLSGDFASFYNLEHEDAFNKIRSGISGETEPLKQLGINMSVANLEAYALSQGIKKQYGKMTEAEKVNLRYNYILEKGKDATGDFAKTSDGFANQLRLVSSNFKQLGANIAVKFLPSLNNGLKLVNLFVTDGILKLKNRLAPLNEKITLFYEKLKENGVISAFGSVINTVIESIKRLLEAINKSWLVTQLKDAFENLYNTLSSTKTLQQAKSILESLGKIITNVTNFIVNNWGILENLILAVGSAFLAFKIVTGVIAIYNSVIVIATTVSTAFGVVMAFITSPIGLIILAITALIFAGVMLYKHWDTVKAFAITIWDGIKNIFSNVVESIKNAINALWDGIKSAFDGIKNTMIGAFEVALVGIKAPINGMINLINGVIEKINGINVKIPDWVPGMGGKEFGVNIPKIPNFATGTNYFRGGLAEINEGGRGEIVTMPNGSKVIPADKSSKMLQGNTNNITINVNGANMSDEQIGNIIITKLKPFLA